MLSTNPIVLTTSHAGASPQLQPSDPFPGLPLELLHHHIFTNFPPVELDSASRVCRVWRPIAFQVAEETAIDFLLPGLEEEFGTELKEKFKALLTGSALLKVQMWAAANFPKIDSFIDADPMGEESTELKVLFKELSILQLLLKMPSDNQTKNLVLLLQGKTIKRMRTIFERHGLDAYATTFFHSFFNSWMSWELAGCELYKQKFIHWRAYGKCYKLYNGLSEELRPLYLKMSPGAAYGLGLLEDPDKLQGFIRISCETPQKELEEMIDRALVEQFLHIYEAQQQALIRLQQLIQEAGSQLSQQDRQWIDDELDQICQDRLS